MHLDLNSLDKFASSGLHQFKLNVLRSLSVLQMAFSSNTNTFAPDVKFASIYSVGSCREKIQSVADKQCLVLLWAPLIINSVQHAKSSCTLCKHYLQMIHQNRESTQEMVYMNS